MAIANDHNQQLSIVVNSMISSAEIATNARTNTRTRVMLSAWLVRSVRYQLRHGGGYILSCPHQDMKCRNVFGTIMVAVLAPSICT